MRTLIWTLFGIAFAIWSFVSWLAYKFIDFGGNIAAGNADMFGLPPEAVEFASWLALLGAGIGEWLVIAIWALGSAVMWFGSYLLTRLLPGASRRVSELRDYRNVRQ